MENHSHAGAKPRAAGIFIAIVLIALVAAGSFAAGSGESAPESSRGASPGAAKELSVFVSIQPQRYFVERIAGELAEVSVLVPPNRGPATYEPTPKQVNALGAADVYFRIGVPFEKAFVPRLRSTVPQLRIVDTSSGIERRPLEARAGGEGSAPPDPHIWVSPPLVKRQAANIRDALIELAPGHRERFEENYRDFASDIDTLHRDLEELLSPVRGQTLFVYHPGFGYFAEAYGLEQEAIETGGDQPSAAQLQRLIERAREEKVRVIFVQPQFAQEEAEQIARAIDGAVVTVNHLAADWLENMRELAREVREGLERE